jgi:hypothetical protein
MDAHINARHARRPNVYLREEDLQPGYRDLKKAAEKQGLMLTTKLLRARFRSSVHADKRCPIGQHNPPR